MKVCVVGAGTMGRDIAQVFAQKERYTTLLCSSTAASANAGKDKIAAKLFSRVEKGKMEQGEAERILNAIHITELTGCADCDLIIEAIPEDMGQKKALFSQLTGICREDCIFASDTSSLSITELAVGIKQPVIGMHFFNPATVMKLVEISPGLNTPPEIVRIISDIAVDVGKTPVEVKENAGFLVNRMLIPMINEAIGLYAEGVASVEGIDTAMRLGANHPMGPLALGDMIGLDVCLAIMEVIHAESGDNKYRPHPLLRKMVRGGHLGVKTGIGFYKY